MRNRVLGVFLVLIVLGAGAFWLFQLRTESVDVVEVTFEQSQDPDFAVLQEAEERIENPTDEMDTTSEETGQDLEEDQPVVQEEPDVSDIEAAEENIIPAQMNLAVPFTSQAPHANWDLPYGETCEEASAYMVWLYFQGYASGVVDPDVADAALLELVAYQEQILGEYLDTTAQETVDFIKGFYGLHAYVVEDPTVEQMKEQIAAGYPVILPAAGRELGNPNFSGEGPLYHMIVLRGYTEDLWISNDPGTRNGQGYVYDIDVIMNAMGDWNDGDPANGAKRVIFIEP